MLADAEGQMVVRDMRSTSKRSGSAKTSSSRFADGYHMHHLVAFRIFLPRSSKSVGAVRRKCMTARVVAQELLDGVREQRKDPRATPALWRRVLA